MTRNSTSSQSSKFRREIPWLDFEPVDHKYYIDGKEVPSVSECLGLAKFNTTRYGKNNTSAWRGTSAHSACELDDEGVLDESSVDPRLTGYLKGWRKFKAEKSPEMVLIEQKVGQRLLGYAGTMDRLALINGAHTVLDIKTGAVRDWHEIQAAGYVLATMFCAPELGLALNTDFAAAAVYLTHDGDYKYVPVPNIFDACEVFRGAMPRVRWQKALNSGGERSGG